MLLNLREVVIQGQVHLKTEVQALLRHLVERWNDTVRSKLAATVTTPPTASRAGSAASIPGSAWRGG